MLFNKNKLIFHTEGCVGFSHYKIEDEITDWSFLDEESSEEVLVEEDYYNQGDDYILSIFKGKGWNC